MNAACKWCGKPTTMEGTKMCDGCWELDHRIRGDLPLAERIVEHYKSVQPAEIPLNAEFAKVCHSAVLALRSYQYGNSATDLAEEVADALQAALAKVWP